MERQEAFKKLMTVFKTRKLTPVQMGTITRQYFERYSSIPEVPVDYTNEIESGLFKTVSQ